MKGTINYLTTLARICEEHKGQCRNCNLGKGYEVEAYNCPHLVKPYKYSIDRLAQ